MCDCQEWMFFSWNGIALSKNCSARRIETCPWAILTSNSVGQSSRSLVSRCPPGLSSPSPRMNRAPGQPAASIHFPRCQPCASRSHVSVKVAQRKQSRNATGQFSLKSQNGKTPDCKKSILHLLHSLIWLRTSKGWSLGFFPKFATLELQET